MASEGELEELTFLTDLTPNPALEQLPERGHTHHAGDPAFLQPVREAIAVDLVQIDNSGTHCERKEQAAGELEGVV